MTLKSILSIDPGYAKAGQGCACAALQQGFLAAWWFERPEDFEHHGRNMDGLDVVIWEKPQMDKRTYNVPPNVIIELTAAGGCLAGLYSGATGASLVAITPSAAKGSAHKPQAHADLWLRLTEAERRQLGGDATWDAIDAACEKGARCRWNPKVDWYPKSWLMHNILDAVAQGVGYVGR